MSLVNFKSRVHGMMLIELEAWQKCEKDWNMGNQFDESVLESALQNFDKMSDEDWSWWKNADQDIMGIAHALSAFEAPELDSAWID